MPKRSMSQSSQGTTNKKQKKTMKLYQAIQAQDETKYQDFVFEFDASNNFWSSNGGGATKVLNDVSPGTAYNERVGRKIRSKYLQYDVGFTVSNQNSANEITGGVFCTMWLVLDRQPNIAVPPFDQVIDTNGSINTGFAGFKAINSGGDRFKILAQHRTLVSVGILSGEDTTGTGPYLLESNRMHGFIKLSKNQRDSITRFSSDSGKTVPETNSYLLLFTTSGLQESVINFSGVVRYAYTDL